MESHLHSILAVLGLFALGVLSPGPNFVVVVQASMSAGHRAGVATGLGVALGDTLYAAVGMAGMETLMTRAGTAMGVIRLLGGLYLIGLGVGMLIRRPARARRPVLPNRSRSGWWRSFLRGLLTDLSNPKTIVFFAGIFAVAYRPGGPGWVAAATLAAIAGFSVLWRTGLSSCFSRQLARTAYDRFELLIRRACGAVLATIGLRFANGE